MLSPYKLRRPKLPVTHRPPLLVLLHGKGANEDDLFVLADRFDPRFAVLSLCAPHEIAPGYYRWYERFDGDEGSVFNEAEIEASRLFLIQAINDAVMAFGADPREVYLFGFSQGAAMAITVALTAPSKVRGVIAIAGRLLASAAHHAAPPNALKHLVVLLQHGRDDDMVPISESHSACALFAEVGIMQGLNEYAAGHTITPSMLKDALAFLSVQLDTTLRPSVSS